MRFISCFVGFTLATVIMAQPVAGSVCKREPIIERPVIGLVLGGGGARGAAHIGVLKLLEEMRVPVDRIAGTSMGSIVGGLFATGLSAAELEDIVIGQDWENIFVDQTARADRPFRRKRDDDFNLFGPKFGIGKDSSLLPRGAFAGQKIVLFFESVVGERVRQRNFDDLPIPYRAVAADLVTGDEVVLTEGDLTIAMRASMSIPAAFDPVPMGDRLLVDGGVVNNLPVNVARDMGADVVIVVDVGTPLASAEELTNVLSITGQLTGLLVNGNTTRQLATLTPDDVLILPPLGSEIAAGDFTKMDNAIPLGYEGATRQRAALAALSLSERDYSAHRAQITSCVDQPAIIDFVRIDNRSRFRDAVIEERLHVKPGEPFDGERLDADMAQIYALGFIEYARYSVVEEDGKSGLVVQVQQDLRGTAFVETGIDLIGDSDGTDLNLRVGLLKTDLDSYGSELRVLGQAGQTPALYTELYKPFGPPLQWIFNPAALLQRREVNLFDDDGNRLAIFKIDELDGTLALGREFGRSAALFAAVRWFTGDINVQTGDPAFGDEHFQGGEYVFRGRYDTLDDRYFPSSGALLRFRYSLSDSSLGADEHYDQLGISAFGAKTWGHHTLIAGSRYNTTLGDDAPVYALYSGGGFMNLSGLETDEVAGQHLGVGLARYRYRFSGTGLMPAFVGTSVEYGTAANDRDDIIDDGIWNGSLYLGYRSLLGPLYLGIGFAEDDRRTYFLKIGNVFGQPGLGR
jgi:NTE family protein